MASLYLRKNTWWISDYKEGCFSTHKKIRKEAEEVLKDFQAKKRLNILEPDFIMPISSVKLSEGFQMFLSTKQHEKKTSIAYQTAINHLIEASEDKLLFKYNENDYINLLRRFSSLSTNSKACYTRHLRAVFDYFKKQGMIKENPIRRVKPVKKEVKTIPLENLDKMYENLKKRKMIKQYELVKLSFLAALRLGEVINVEGDDIDLRNNIMYVRNTKGKRVDKIPLVKDLKKFVKTLHLNGKMFPYKTNDGAKRFWQTLNKQLKFNYTHHQLRKTRGTQLANLKVAPLFLQKFMRHQSLTTTMEYYVNLDIQKMREDIDDKL